MEIYNEEAVIRNHLKLNTLLQNLPGAVYSCKNDKDWTTNFISQGIHELSGYEASELTGPDPILLNDLIHPEDRNRVWEEVQTSIKKKEIFELTYRLVTKSNEVKHLFDRGQGIFDESGKLKSIEGIMLDITSRKKTEEQLIKSEARNHAILNAIPDLIFILTADGVFIDCQAQDPSLLLHPKKEFIGRKITDFFDSKLSKKVFQSIKKVTTSGQPQNFEYPLNINNQERYFDARIVKYNDQQVLALIRDITQSKKNQRTAIELETRFYKAFHLSPSPVSITEFETGKVIDVNNKFLEIAGVKREEIIGKSAVELNFWNKPEQREVWLELLKTKGHVHDLEGGYTTQDNRRLSLLISSELIDIDGKSSVLTMIYDITQRKKAEEDLVKLTHELSSSNKNLRQFAFMASHNLRTPVFNIDSLLKLYNEKQLGDPENLVVIDKMKKSITQLKSNLHDLIALIQVNENKNNPDEIIFFDTILSNVIQGMETQINTANATINADFSNAKSIFLKKIVLESVIQNLLSNAIKYCNKEPIIDLKTYEKGDEIYLVVKDNGIGIDLEKYGDKLFGMYQRFNLDIEGKGLGLYIIKNQIESVKGKIHVESEPGKGSVFTITFKKIEQNS